MKAVLKTENLTKDYGNQRGAIDISLEIFEGEAVGFIGPNGAGKTTAMKMISKLINPDSMPDGRQAGKLFIAGKEIADENDYLKVARNMVYLPSEGGLYENLTPRSLFNYAAKLYECNTDLALDLADKFKLDLDVVIKNLSFGNRRKVAIIQALMNKPKLAILDEPTSGLDPLIQRQVLGLILEAKKAGSSVFLSSHNLGEVESVCDRIVMIKASRIIFTGSTKEVLNKSLKRFRIENVKEEFYNKVKALPSVKKSEFVTDDVIAYVDNPQELIEFLNANKNYNFFIEKPTLEEAFLEYY